MAYFKVWNSDTNSILTTTAAGNLFFEGLGLQFIDLSVNDDIYNLYRNGSLLESNINTTSYIDGELEPTIEAFQYAVGLAKEAINNELTGGFIDTDILTDSGPVKCADVLAALDTLSEVIRVILTTGPDSVAVGYPDYFNGENTIFDLYYEDGTPVDTETNEEAILDSWNLTVSPIIKVLVLR